MSDPTGTDDRTTAVPSRTATSLFDLRTVLAVLFGVYGIVLLVLGLASTDAADLAKAGGWNINLWTGSVMLAVAVLFVGWVVLRPLHPPAAAPEPPPPGSH